MEAVVKNLIVIHYGTVLGLVGIYEFKKNYFK